MTTQTLDSILHEWIRIDECLRAAAGRSHQRWPFQAVGATKSGAGGHDPSYKRAGTRKHLPSPSIRAYRKNAAPSLKRTTSSSSSYMTALEFRAYKHVHEYLSYFRKVESFTHLYLLKELLRVSVIGWLLQVSLATDGFLRLPFANCISQKQNPACSRSPSQDSNSAFSSQYPSFTEEVENGKRRRTACKKHLKTWMEEWENRVGDTIPWKSNEHRERWIHFTRVLRRRWCQPVSTALSSRKKKGEEGGKETTRESPHGSPLPSTMCVNFSEPSVPSVAALSSTSPKKKVLARKCLHELAAFATHYAALLQFLHVVFIRLLHLPVFTEIAFPGSLRLLEDTMAAEMRYFVWENKEALLSALQYAAGAILSLALLQIRKGSGLIRSSCIATLPRSHSNCPPHHPVPPSSSEEERGTAYLQLNAAALHYGMEASEMMALVEASQLDELQRCIAVKMQEWCFHHGTSVALRAFGSTKEGPILEERQAEDHEKSARRGAALVDEKETDGIGACSAPFSSFTWPQPTSAFQILHALRQCLDGYRSVFHMIWTFCEQHSFTRSTLDTSPPFRLLESCGSWQSHFFPPAGGNETYKNSGSRNPFSNGGKSRVGGSLKNRDFLLHPDVDQMRDGVRESMWCGRADTVHQLPRWEQVIFQKALVGYWEGVASCEALLSVIQRDGVPLWRLSCEQEFLNMSRGGHERRHRMSERVHAGREEARKMESAALSRPPHPLWPLKPIKNEFMKGESAATPVPSRMRSSSSREPNQPECHSILWHPKEGSTMKVQKEVGTGEKERHMMDDYMGLLAASPSDGYPSLLLMLYLLIPARPKLATGLHDRIADYLSELLHQYDAQSRDEVPPVPLTTSSSSSISSLPLPALVLEECIYLLKMNRLCFEDARAEPLCRMAAFFRELHDDDEKKPNVGAGGSAMELLSASMGTTSAHTSRSVSLMEFAMETASSGMRKFFSTCETRVAATLAHALDYYTQLLIRKRRRSEMPEGKKASKRSGKHTDSEEPNNPIVVIEILVHLASLLEDASMFSKYYAELLSSRALAANSASDLEIDRWVVGTMEVRLGFFSASSCILLLRDVVEAIHDRRSAIVMAPLLNAKKETRKNKKKYPVPLDRFISLDSDRLHSYGYPSEDACSEETKSEEKKHQKTLKLPLGSIRTISAKPNYLMRRLKVLRISRWRPYVTLLESSRSIKKMFEHGNWLSESFVDAILRAEWYYNHSESEEREAGVSELAYAGYGSFRFLLPQGLENLVVHGNRRHAHRRPRMDEDAPVSMNSDMYDERDRRSSISRISQSTTFLVAGLSTVFSSAVQQATTQTRGFKAFTRNASLGNDDSDDDEEMQDEYSHMEEEPASPFSYRPGGYFTGTTSPQQTAVTDGNPMTTTTSGGGGLMGTSTSVAMGVARPAERSSSWFSLSNLAARSVGSATRSFSTASTATAESSVNSMMGEEEKRKLQWSLGCGWLCFTVSEDVPSTNGAPCKEGNETSEKDPSFLPPPSSLSKMNIAESFPVGSGKQNEESSGSPISISIRGPPIALLLLQLLDRASEAEPLTFNQILTHLPLRVPKPIVGQMLKSLLTSGLVKRVLHSFPKDVGPNATQQSYHYGYYMVEHLSSSMPSDVQIVVHYRMAEEAPPEDPEGVVRTRKVAKKHVSRSRRPPLSAFAPLRKDALELQPSPALTVGKGVTARDTDARERQVCGSDSASETTQQPCTANDRETALKEAKALEQLRRETLHLAIIRSLKKEVVMTHDALYERVSSEVEVTPAKFKSAIAFLLEREYVYRSNTASYCINKSGSSIGK